MKKEYTVLNFGSFIVLPTLDKNIPLTIEGGTLVTLEPYEKDLTIDEIKFINRTDVFKTGRLEFKEEDRKELYKLLRIDDLDRLWLANDVLDTLIKPTKEKLERLVRTNDLNIIDRFLEVVVSSKTTSMYDIPARVSKLVESRKREIYENPNKPTKHNNIKRTKNEEDESAKEEAINSALLEMKSELESKYLDKIKELEKKIPKTKEVKKDEEKPKRGRPSTKKVE